MLTNSGNPVRTPTESVRSESVHSAQSKDVSEHVSNHSSASEDEESEKASTPRPPPAPKLLPFQTTFSKPKATPPSSKSSTTTSSMSKSSSANNNHSKTINTKIFKPLNVQSINKNGNGKTDNKTIGNLVKILGPNGTSKEKHIRVSARDIENEALSPTILKYLHGDKSHYRSIFEKVDTHSGRVTYLGSGSFSDIESCICNNLSRKRYYRDYSSISPRYECYPSRSFRCASILEDYSYDGIISSKGCRTKSYGDYCHYDIPCKSAADLSLDEIRKINDNLAKYGIPVFTDHHHHPNPYHPPRSVGDLIGACRKLMEDPRLATYTSDNQAVHHVWDAAHNYRPNPSYPAYPPPQPPPQPPSGGSSQGVLARLFGQPQAPPAPPPPPPPPPSGGSSQGVLARLFGQPQAPPPAPYPTSPYGASFH